MYVLLAMSYYTSVDGGDTVCGDATTFALQGYGSMHIVYVECMIC